MPGPLVKPFYSPILDIFTMVNHARLLQKLENDLSMIKELSVTDNKSGVVIG
jgi:hypothetical protein